MRFKEFATKNKTPEQLKVDALKANKEKASKALADERKRQQATKAQKTLAKLQAPSIHTI